MLLLDLVQLYFSINYKIMIVSEILCMDRQLSVCAPIEVFFYKLTET